MRRVQVMVYLRVLCGKLIYEFSQKVPFASEDVHSVDVARSEASSDAKAVLRFEGLSEKAPI